MRTSELKIKQTKSCSGIHLIGQILLRLSISAVWVEIMLSRAIRKILRFARQLQEILCMVILLHFLPECFIFAGLGRNSIANEMFSGITTTGTKYSLKTSDKVLVIGLGQLGLPVAKYVKEKGFDVYGYDISQKAIQRAEKIAAIKKADNFSEFDVYIICISTHKPDDMFTPQIDGLLSIVQEKIAKEAKNGALVSIESTIPRGTSKKVFEMLNHRLHVAHIPHRWYALEEREHGVNQLRVVGGV